MKRLGNGVVLDETLNHKRNKYYLTKTDARRVFNGNVLGIRAKCINGPTCCNGAEFHITRATDGSIAIGCVPFSVAQVEIVKQWLKVKQAARAAT